MKIPDKTYMGILRKILWATGIVFAVFLCVGVFLSLTLQPDGLQISDVEMAAVRDGIYTASASNGLVKAAVSVEVSNGRILDISIIEHEHLLGKKAEKITESIISQQSLEVDAVSSATYSSNVLRKAVENALRKGE